MGLTLEVERLSAIVDRQARATEASLPCNQFPFYYLHRRVRNPLLLLRNIFLTLTSPRLVPIFCALYYWQQQADLPICEFHKTYHNEIVSLVRNIMAVIVTIVALLFAGVAHPR